MKGNWSQEYRPWNLEDLGNRKAYLREIPILALEKWESRGEQGDFVVLTTSEIHDELIKRRVLQAAMKPKGTGNLVGSFIQKQTVRRLSPPLVMPLDEGTWGFYVRQYAELLRAFRSQVARGVPSKATSRLTSSRAPGSGESMPMDSLVKKSVDGIEGFADAFDKTIQLHASTMAQQYALFYCIEVHLRDLVSRVLTQSHKDSWWQEAVPEGVQRYVKDLRTREADFAITERSPEPIDYTTFGQLGDIILHNWNLFRDTFKSKKAIERIMEELNTLRGPIAHCCLLADDEVDRLVLRIKDLLRQLK